ncbi:MAG: phosphoribosylformylglycinamidine cyclo-ligase [Candidatus Moranbacteria bacterium]|nr:phosphoribosylformylglycinamidine cyclo-ligase [Candidatus Moranbacteria bacterium]
MAGGGTEPKEGLTYEGAGVSIEAGEEAVDRIREDAASTHKYFGGKPINAIGGFAFILELPCGTVLGFSTDGVGTKLRTAFISGYHELVGIDLAAMVFNDILVYGFIHGVFLDYISQGVQKPDRTKAIISGMIRGCHMAQFGLGGGEMAELPGFYKEEEYDLAGFGVGILPDRRHLIMGESIVPGMYAYGIASSGLHSNGFSLLWATFGIDFKDPDQAGERLNAHYPELGRTLLEEVSVPTILYRQGILDLNDKYEIAGMANVTGGGLARNPQRILPPGCSVAIKRGSWPIPPIFSLIQKRGNVAQSEMDKTFNNGIGFIVYSPNEIREEGVYKIGQVVEGSGEVIFI